MDNNYDINARIEQLKALKKRTEKIGSRMNEFTDKYNKLLKLIEKTDSTNKIPRSIKNIEGRIGSVKVAIMKRAPKSFANMKYAMLAMSTCEMACESLFNHYGSTLDDLIELYTEKYNVIVKMKALDKKSTDDVNMQDSNNSLFFNKSRNYKAEAIKMIDLFDTFGVTDENLLKNTRGKTLHLDQKERDCLHNLNDVVNNVSPTEMNEADIVEIKKILEKLGRMNMLNEDAKNREYESIEEYISKLAGRNMRITREKGEDLADNTIDNKLVAMQMLGVINSDEIEEKDLLNLAQLRKDDLDEISKIYLKNLVEILRSVSPSELMAKDAIKIKDMLIKLSQAKALDDEEKDKIYDSFEEYIEELSHKKGNTK